ncbi:unnamed protein product [Orchesella dallaii]|uniref:LEM domain-containing protein n=1 Tax=Orchesella dallaii TaxID=48710 RepID=A0ABP1R0Q3_9HEXA
MASSTNKTKDWFKNQLISYGVALPSSSAKKEEYQRLYEEQVLPQQNNTEFSSDDDTEQPSEVVQPRAPSMPKSSRVETSKQASGTDFAEWVNRMSDKNLFDALTACEKTPGPIVDSTRDFYRKMLLDTLKETPDLTMRNIEVYLSENPDIIWEAGGVSVNGTNGVTTNGKSENGFSDSDDEEHVETASRASRSSRASSKRATPARTPRSPVKPIVNPPTPVSAQASSKLETESRRTARAVRENIFSSVDADYKLRTQDDDQLMNRLASPGT